MTPETAKTANITAKKPPGGFGGVISSVENGSKGKLPALQFYVGDWRKSPDVQACTLAARGLWIEMLFIMHESSPRGFLELNGQPISNDRLARMVGSNVDEVALLIKELESVAVFSRDERGVIYSRRITKDEHIRRVRSEAGLKGAKFGYLGGRPTKVENGEETVKRQKRQNNPPSSSSSSSDILSVETTAPTLQDRKPKTPRKTKELKPRARDPLFDSILEVTSKDQKPGYVGKVCTSLKDRNFTPEDVRYFAAHWRELFAWATPEKQPRLTPGIIDNHIHVIREKSAQPATQIVKRGKDNPLNFEE
jgi:hypothetical protein